MLVHVIGTSDYSPTLIKNFIPQAYHTNTWYLSVSLYPFQAHVFFFKKHIRPEIHHPPSVLMQFLYHMSYNVVKSFSHCTRQPSPAPNYPPQLYGAYFFKKVINFFPSLLLWYSIHFFISNITYFSKKNYSYQALNPYCVWESSSKDFLRQTKKIRK